jgi:flagellar basal-body rod modification protein FlgD
MDKDAFMKLLLTQMKNQDPTNPMQSHEMAAQLAQFTTLEKLNNINMGIDGLRKDQKPDHNFQALYFIGIVISTDTSKIARTDESAVQNVRFTLPSDAQKVTMVVKDADGKAIRTLEYKMMKAGKNEIDWNGMDDQGNVMPVGQYTAEIEAVVSNGHKLGVKTKT